MKHATKSREATDRNEEKDQVEKIEAELKLCEVFMHEFAKETMDWTRKMKTSWSPSTPGLMRLVK